MAELRAYRPTLRDRIAAALLGDTRATSSWGDFVQGLVGSTGLGATGPSMVDFTPAGMVLSGNEAVRAAQNGQYGEAALNAAGAIPGGFVMGALAKGAMAGKALKDAGEFGIKEGRNITAASEVSPSYAQGIFPPPTHHPLTPFDEAYKKVLRNAKTPEQRAAIAGADGRLLIDRDGFPLEARYTAGYNRLGGAPETLSPAELDAIAEEAFGRRPEIVAPSSLPKGAIGKFDPDSGQIAISNKLSDEDKELVLGHEFGHGLDHHAGSYQGLRLPNTVDFSPKARRELRTIFNDLNNSDLAKAREANPNVDPKDVHYGLGWTPQKQGYRDAQAPMEYNAEAFRAYSTGPNYFNIVAPTAAKEMRAAVRNNPRLRKIIQFNSLAAAGGAGAVAMMPDDAKASEMANWWEAAPLVEQPKATAEGNWWEAAPLVEDAQQPEQRSPEYDAALSEMSGLTGQKGFDRSRTMADADKIEAIRQPGAFSDATDSILQGIPFGDEIVSGMMALPRAAVSAVKGEGFDVGREYNRAMDLDEELRRRREERSPVASTVGSVAGGLGAGGVAAKSGLTLLNGAKPTLASLAGRGMGEGAIWGGLYGAGEGRGFNDRAFNAATGAGTGALIGGATGALARVGAGKIDTAALPTADDLKSAAATAYQRADDAGVIYSPQAVQRVRDQLTQEFTDFGFHPELQSGAKVALGEINRLADGNVTLKGLDTARKVAGNAYQMGNKANNTLTAKVMEAIDNLVANPQTGDVITGNAPEAAQAIQEARGLYRQAAKLDTVETLLKRAGLRAASTGSGGNIENATRQELRKILTSEKMRRGFTEQELKAIEKAVVGSKGQDLLRLAGKMSPEGNGLSLMLHLLGGSATGGATLPLAAGGMLAKRAADAMSTSNARIAEALIASGGNLPVPKLSATRKAIIDLLTRSGAQVVPMSRN
jgi:hypothetical protein